MIMEIHSKFGVLICKPMELQAIEKSIPESEVQEQNQDTEATVGEQDAVSPASADNEC